MNKHIGFAIAIAVFSAQLQSPACAEISEEFDGKDQLRPPIQATSDNSSKAAGSAPSSPSSAIIASIASSAFFDNKFLLLQ